MKLVNKLRALLFRGENMVTMDLAAAEIRAGRAYLHPRNDRMKTYVTRSKDIEIRIRDDSGLGLAGIKSIEKKPKENNKKEGNKSDVAGVKNQKKAADELERFKKRTFSITLYQEEYDALMKRIQEYGYKKAEFVIACASTATPGTMDRTHKKIVKARKEIRQEERAIKAKNREQGHDENVNN